MKKTLFLLTLVVIISFNFMCKKMDNNLNNDETLIKLPNHLITQPLGGSQEDLDNYKMLVGSMNVNFEKIKAIYNNAVNLNQLINLKMAFYAKIDSSEGRGLGLVFASNADSTLIYCILSKDKNYSTSKPVIIKIIGRKEVAFYDLDLNLYKNVSILSSGKITSTEVVPIFNNNTSHVSLMSTNYTLSSCGQATMNCINDAYSNHGWVSVWAWVQSLYLPATGVAIAAACAAKNCL
ncbi:hypothetical protein [Hydrotalea sp.]|uniref:hypothetical protein n=1 Tax=Hydrotalea sp. TaxID=2881279 RepID=UPI002587D96E|nr:hypothetical protein [Hydrotalea sp.]